MHSVHSLIIMRMWWAVSSLRLFKNQSFKFNSINEYENAHIRIFHVTKKVAELAAAAAVVVVCLSLLQLHAWNLNQIKPIFNVFESVEW